MEKDYRALKKEAEGLRRKGLSYNEIRREIGTSKSTLSMWLKTIPLKDEYKKRLYTKQIAILSRGPQSQKERRAREVEEIIKKAFSEIALPLSKDIYRLVGAAIYWGEGSKKGLLEITNSDPCLILFMVRWLEKIFGMPPEQLGARLNIYPQQNENEIKKFWSDLTKIPVDRFGKSYVKPLRKNYKKNNLYYGTIKVEAPRSVDKKHKIFGWIKAILKDIDPDIQITRKKWTRLENVKRPVNL